MTTCTAWRSSSRCASFIVGAGVAGLGVHDQFVATSEPMRRYVACGARGQVLRSSPLPASMVAWDSPDRRHRRLVRPLIADLHRPI